MNHKKEIWDTFYLIALQGFNYLAPLIVFPYLMITLGAEKFGYIGFSLAITQYLMLIVNFGFHLSATKRVALCKENQTELNKVFSATLVSKLGLLGICFVIMLIFAFAIPRFSIYSKTLLVLFSMVDAEAAVTAVKVTEEDQLLSFLPLSHVLERTAGYYAPLLCRIAVITKR